MVSRRDFLGKSAILSLATVSSALRPSLLLDNSSSTNSLALIHTGVIDATGQPALPDRTVIILGNRIQAIGKFSETKVPKDARVIDATGKWLIPGLWDMHVHFRGGSNLISDNEAWLSIFIANGITGVREMGGDIADTVFRWRAEVANGMRLGPRIVTSGPKLDGPKPSWPGSIAISDPASARAAVDNLKAMGSDFVKIYSGNFPPDVFAALMDEAHKQGLAVGGHMPFMTMTVRDAIRNGVKFIEHADLFVLPGCSKSEKQINDEFAARLQSKLPMSLFERSHRFAQTFDEDTAHELSAELVEHNTWVTPTVAVLRQIESIGRTDYSQHAQRKYVLPGIWQTWDPKGGIRHPLSDETIGLLKPVREKTSEIIKLLQSSGVGLLAGSDSAAFNSYTFPGWILHRELEFLVESGLSPLEALQTATRNPARFLDELSSSGTIEEGKIANLVLLTANPLDDVRNTQRIDAVVLKGNLLTRADLDKLLQNVATKAALPS